MHILPCCMVLILSSIALWKFHSFIKTVDAISIMFVMMCPYVFNAHDRRIVAQCVSFAGIQFIRKPKWLKTKLQKIRAVCGPLYIISMCEYAHHQQQIVCIAAACVACVSIIGGVILRPDNSA